MSKFLKSLIEAGKCPLLLDFRTGSLNDLSGNGNDAVVSGTTKWTNESGSRRLVLAQGNSLYVPHHDSLNVSELTIVSVLSKGLPSPTNSRWFTKHTTPNYGTYFSGTTFTPNLQGTVTSVCTATPPNNMRSLGLTWVSGQKGRYFWDSSLGGETTAAVTIAANNTQNLWIGNYGGHAGAYDLGGSMANFILINEALSDVDMVRLMRELEQGPTIVSRPRTHFSIPYPSKTADEYAAENITDDHNPSVIQAGKPVTSLGVQGTFTGSSALQQGGPFGQSLTVRDGQMTFPATEFDPAADSFTFTQWCFLESYPTTAYYIAYKYGGTGWYSSLSASGRLTVIAKTTSASVGTASLPAESVPEEKWTQVGYTIDRSTNLLCGYIDGKVVCSIDASAIGAGTMYLASSFVMGAIYNMDGVQVAMNRAYDVALTPAEMRTEYLIGARKCLLDARVYRDGSCPVSLETVTVLAEIANGWKNETAARWHVREETPTSVGEPGDRYFQSYGAGTATIGRISIADPNPPYGSWYFKTQSVAGGRILFYIFSTPDVLSNARLSYIPPNFYLVSSLDGTIDTTTALVNDGTPIEFWISRDFTGLMKVWCKGANLPDWTLVLEGVSAITDSLGTMQFGGYSSADYRCYDVVHYQGEMTPFESIEQNLIDGEIPEPFWTVTTTDLTQNWQVRLTAGSVFVFDWGDGQQEWFTSDGTTEVFAHTYASTGTYEIKVYLDQTQLELLICRTNSLVGSVPLVTSPSIDTIWFAANSLTGEFSVAGLTGVSSYYVYENPLGGTIPSLTSLTSLTVLAAYTNAFTGYTPSTLSLTITTFFLQDNALTQTAVDAILADFLVGAAGRPGAGTINLSGGTNATPTASIKAACVSALPGWTITTA